MSAQFTGRVAGRTVRERRVNEECRPALRSASLLRRSLLRRASYRLLGRSCSIIDQAAPLKVAEPDPIALLQLKEGVLVAWGFTEQGERVLLAVMLGMRESHWGLARARA